MAFLGAVVGAAITAGGALWVARMNNEEPKAATPEVVRLAISPKPGPLPMCVLVEGTAIKPKDMTVWMAIGREDLPDRDYYGLQKVTQERSRPDQWHAQVNLGGEQEEPDTVFTAYVFALHQEASALLESVGAENDYFFLRDLPVEAVSQQFKRDSSKKKPC